MKRSLTALVCALSLTTLAQSKNIRTGFVDDANAKNVALLVGVTYGLPGIDLDLKNVNSRIGKAFEDV